MRGSMMLRKVLFLSIFLILPLSSLQLKAEEKTSDCLACHQKDTREFSRLGEQ